MALRQITRRFVISIFIVYVVITISFFLIRLMPGNAMEYMYQQLLMSHTVSPEQAMQQVKDLYDVNIKQPLIVQYFLYMWNLLHGDLGRSTLYPGTTVVRLLANAMPWTIVTVSVSMLLSFILGISVGTIIAYFRRTWFSSVLTSIMTVLNAVPNYIVAILLLYWLADLHHLFPTGGAYDPSVQVGWNAPFFLSVANHASLPIGAYVITHMSGWALGMKSNTVSVLGEEYITAARARGIGNRRIAQSFVGRNAILPMVTSLGMSVGFMFGGSVFIESMFNYPGIGFYLGSAVGGRDYPLMMGAFMLTTSSVVLANFIADIVNLRLDPRTRVRQ